MVEARHTLHLAQLRARLHFATRTLALQAAMKITKRRLQAQGLKVSHFPQREIRTQAEVYLCAHRETLIAEARVTVERWRRDGFFGTRAQCAPLNTAAQTRKA
jgi:hypothetical protein